MKAVSGRGRNLKPGLRRTKVAQARIDKRVSLAELEQQTGINFQTIHMYEVGLHVPRVDKAILLAKALGQSVEQLFGEAA